MTLIQKEEIVKAKTLISSFLIMYEEASKYDSGLQEEIGDFNAIIQIRVKDHDEIAGYFEFKDKRVFAHLNQIHENPDATILLADVPTVKDFITESRPAIDLYIKGKLKVLPENQTAMQKALKMQSLYELMRFYIEPIKKTKPKT
ncbi:MAG: hypothetical protein ACXQS8_02420 [Candidatus Helarchaeales archaeon]